MTTNQQFPEYIENFINHIQIVENKSDKTLDAYRVDLLCFLRFLKIYHNDVDPNKIEWLNIPVKDVPFDYIKQFTIQDAYSYMSWLKKNRNNSAKTRSRKTSSLKHFYSYLSNKVHLLENNPIEALELPRQEKTLPKYLSVDQAKKLLSSINTKTYERDFCIITLFLNCGMRLSELNKINMEDISLDSKTVRLYGKGRKERIVDLNAACVSALDQYIATRKPIDNCDALFYSGKHNRLSTRRIQEIVEKCLKAAGLGNLGITPHKLRHTAATLLYNNGVDTLVLKELLGHESIATTQIYTHLGNGVLKKAVEMNPLNENTKKNNNEDNN